jgi:hypothetical protein
MKGSVLIYSFMLVFLSNTSCNKEEKRGEVKVPSATKSTWESEEYGLDRYFEKHEIKPTAVFYNKYDSSEILFFNHRIKWINKDNHIQLNINGDVFSLDGETTLNSVWGSDKDSVHFVNNWDEIKYYKSPDYEVVGIRMHFDRCNGLGCSVNHFLWYDLKKKTKNYFGTFRTENKLALYSFNNNKSVDYLSKTFVGDAQGATEMNFITELYSLNEKGKFVLQKNPSGDAYRITQTTFPNDTTIEGDRVTIHWFENIKE